MKTFQDRKARRAARVAILLLAATAAVHLMGTEAALAQDQVLDGAFTPVQAVLQAIVNFVTGPFGRLVAIVAVIGLGFLAFAGRLSWFTAGAVIIGIGLVFGAPTIVDQLRAIAT